MARTVHCAPSPAPWYHGTLCVSTAPQYWRGTRPLFSLLQVAFCTTELFVLRTWGPVGGYPAARDTAQPQRLHLFALRSGVSMSAKRRKGV
eukprot:3941391-Rhodomonas_salina.2